MCNCKKCLSTPYVGIDLILVLRSLDDPRCVESRKRDIRRRLATTYVPPKVKYQFLGPKEYAKAMRGTPYPCRVDEFAEAEKFSSSQTN